MHSSSPVDSSVKHKRKERHISHADMEHIMNSALSFTEKKILKILRSSPSGLITSEIARELEKSRQTTGKYLEFLKIRNQVICRQMGPVKMWFDKSHFLQHSMLREVQHELEKWLDHRRQFREQQTNTCARALYFSEMEEHLKEIGRIVLAQREEKG